AGAAAYGNGTAPVYVTSVVTAFTTYCPEATEITHGGSTYTVSSATTLTITNCPGGCTISVPVTSSVITECSTCSTEVPTVPATYPTESASYTSAPVVVPTPSGAPYPSSNGTTPVSYAPSGTGAPSASGTGSTVPPSYNGAATYGSAFGAALFAVAGAVAFL
ncbi:hypothetical protein K431DRAFT_191257, partial [Polychaeton citri CBS 116435]